MDSTDTNGNGKAIDLPLTIAAYGFYGLIRMQETSQGLDKSALISRIRMLNKEVYK